MDKIKIRVFDDEQKVGDHYVGQIKRGQPSFETSAIHLKEFEEAMDVLEKRRSRARGQRKTGDARKKCAFDEADILIIDYDLLDLKTASFLTAENVAYLARCYSYCKIIIILNQFGNNPFDLTLKGHPDSYADLNLGSKHLESPGLWGRAWTRGMFRPWVWPVLPDAVAAFESRLKQLKGNLDKPILSFLGLKKITESLPRTVVEFLSGPSAPEEVTFRNFVRRSGNGLRPKDEPRSDDQIAHIAAARIAKWLERLVLPGQDILVDAPHLISRYSSLLEESRQKVANWNCAASLAPLEQLGIDHAKIEDFRFQKAGWISRPAWFWRDVSNFRDIDEVKDPWNAKQPKWVFCEDTSTFELPDKCQQFVADLPSPFVRRFVRNVGNVEYTPSVRFSL